MAKILVTGAAGFIGSHTADLLLALGHDVLGIDNFRSGREENLANASRNPRFRFLREDLTADGLLIRIVAAEKSDAILHLAALVSIPESIADPILNRRLNLDATRVVTAAAVASGSVRRVVFASSAAVYGTNADLPLHETAQTRPLSPYGEAKLESEKILADLSRSQPAISTVALRYFNVYGPRQDPRSPYSGVISILAAAFRDGRPFTLHGDGGQTRDFISVADVAMANKLALTRPVNGSLVLNVCTGQATALTEMIRVMGTITGRSLDPARQPAREGDIRHSLGTPEAAQRHLGFRSANSIETGLGSFLA
jgi:UDP-glucose 4-epimerase